MRDITVGALLDEQAVLCADSPALIFDDGEASSRWSYAELKRKVDELARALIAWGVMPGDNVAVLSPNSPEWVLLEYALAKIGAVLVTVNPALRKAELDYLFRQSKVTTLFTVGEYRGHDISSTLTALMPDLVKVADSLAGRKEGEKAFPHLRRIGVLGGDAVPGGAPFASVLSLAEQVGLAQLIERQSATKPHDVLQIQYTSGTTGAPKGAMLTHHSTINNARMMSARAGFDASDRLLSAMPFFHTAGCVCNVMGMLVQGGCLITMPAFEAGRMLDLLERYRATVINAVPTMYIRMLEDEDFRAGNRDVSSLRIAFTGGTSIPPSMLRELKEKMGADPMVIMGMTECSPIITQTVASDDFEVKITTAGVPLPHTEIMITDVESGKPVAFGQPGELRIRGYLVTKGYFDMPERTRETIDADGWLRSGDLAILDAGGYLQIVGRLKDMVIRGGENIYPAEIEDFLLTHPAVADAQVVGVPDERMGEELFAFIIPSEGQQLEPEDIQDFCRANLSRHKMPRYVECVQDFPLTASGKVQKFQLREMAARLIAERQQS